MQLNNTSAAAAVWSALIAVSASQLVVIDAQDSSRLDELFVEKDFLLDLLAQRDIQADARTEPRLSALIQQVQDHEAAAEAALQAAKENLGEKMASVRSRRVARVAFSSGANPAAEPLPRFLDSRS